MAASTRLPGTARLPSQTLSIDEALAGSDALAQLSRRVQQSQQRLAMIAPLLPAAMQGSVRAGPIDEAGWSLLASNNAVAAKLRQMLPALQAHLQSLGIDGPPLRVKLLGAG